MDSTTPCPPMAPTSSRSPHELVEAMADGLDAIGLKTIRNTVPTLYQIYLDARTKLYAAEINGLRRLHKQHPQRKVLMPIRTEVLQIRLLFHRARAGDSPAFEQMTDTMHQLCARLKRIGRAAVSQLRAPPILRERQSAWARIARTLRRGTRRLEDGINTLALNKRMSKKRAASLALNMLGDVMERLSKLSVTLPASNDLS